MSKQTVILTPAKVKPALYVGQTIILPIVGEVTFSDQGTIEVASDNVDALVEATFESFGFYEKGKETTPGTIQNKNEEYQKTKADLDALDFKGLIALAKDVIDPSKLAAMTEGRIRQVLLEKLIQSIDDNVKK